MRILVLADIHSNWHALRAVHRQEPEFDACLVLGDLVEFGIQPREVLLWVREHATCVIRGNHDQAVAQFVKPHSDETPTYRLRNRMRQFHWETLSRAELDYLARLPVRKTWHCLDGRFRLIHASPRDPLHEYLPDSASLWQKRLQHQQADFVCVGHTHRQYCQEVRDCCLVNPGSVGQQKNISQVAQYAVVEDGKPVLKEASYDLEEWLEEYVRAGFSTGEINLVRRFYGMNELQLNPQC